MVQGAGIGSIMRMKKNRQNCDAFSLIELLVSVVIYVMIILAMSTLFHQSSIAWDGGMRKVRGNSMARGALSFMSRELLTAVADVDGVTFGMLAGDAPEIEFVKLGHESDVTNRTARRIYYGLSGDKLERSEDVCLPGAGYGTYVALGVGVAVLTDNIAPDGLTFSTPPRATDYTNDLPLWVKIRLEVERVDDVSAVGVRCAGPNRIWNDEDDITSW